VTLLLCTLCTSERSRSCRERMPEVAAMKLARYMPHPHYIPLPPGPPVTYIIQSTSTQHQHQPSVGTSPGASWSARVAFYTLMAAMAAALASASAACSVMAAAGGNATSGLATGCALPAQ
jgi:hypothetical protein